jgi:tRNA-specific 2-thiouridylase
LACSPPINRIRQDICFVPGGDYAKIVKKIRPEADSSRRDRPYRRPRVSAQHDGIIHFTIGQRKGLGIGGGHIATTTTPFYVLRIDPAKNQVVVGPKEALAKDVLYIKECNWLSADTDAKE